MNKLRIAVILILLFNALMIFARSPVSVAAQTYPLVCRGGDYRFTYVTHGAHTNRPFLAIDAIRKGSHKVGNHWENLSVLKPGECAWTDRPLSPDEPYQLVYHDINQFSVVWRKKQVLAVAQHLDFLQNMQNPDKYQSFNVYNDRRGSLVISSIGRSR